MGKALGTLRSCLIAGNFLMDVRLTGFATGVPATDFFCSSSGLTIAGAGIVAAAKGTALEGCGLVVDEGLGDAAE
jgi:hypothetical protein